jgi:flagellar hook-length control protein FliK
MRIESPVGCPMAAPEQTEEKSARDGAGSLFTNMMDCFRALLSCASPDVMNIPGQVPPAAGTTDDRQEPPPDAESGTANTATGPTRPSIVRTDAPAPGKESGEEPRAAADTTRFTSAGITFFLTVPCLSTDMPATPDIGMDQGIASGYLDDAEGLAGTAFLVSQEAATPGEPTGLNEGTTSVGDAASRSAIEEAQEPAASMVSAPGDSSAVDRSGQENVAAKPIAITADAGQAEVARAVQAAVAAQVTGGAGASGADRSPGSASNEQGISSPPVQFAAGKSAKEGLAFPARYPRVPITTSLPQTGGGPTSADPRPDNDARVKSGAQPQGADASERRGASASQAQSTDSVATGGEKSVEVRFAFPDDLLQKLPGKVIPATNAQTGSQQQAVDNAAARQGNTEVKADQNLVSQAGGGSKSPSPLKTVTVADGSASAAESQADPASHARIRSIFERGAQDGATVASSPGIARDTQSSNQSASTVVRDVKAPAFMFEVAERISAVVSGARGEVTVQLKPDQFGRMNIVAESGTSGILARITTESASLKQYLENNLPVLQQALQGQGLKVERIDVVVQEGLLQQQSMNQWQHNSGHAPGKHDPGGNSAFAVSARPSVAQPANEITLDAVILGALHPHSTFHTIA